MYFAPTADRMYLFDHSTKSFVKHLIKGADFLGITEGYVSKQLSDGTIYFAGGFYEADLRLEARVMKLDADLNATYLAPMIKPRWFHSAALMRDRFMFVMGG